MQELTLHWPLPGRYVVAVSGGCDSMVLLDVLAGAAKERGYELVVAHFDHGLRPDSAQDYQLVKQAAGGYGLPLVSEQGQLGRASEAAARAARHDFLERIRLRHQAAAVVTAHHEDDLVETSLLNLARGTGRQGLAPMRQGGIARPLLGIARHRLRQYAQDRALQWREDPTNQDQANPRNFVRHQLLPQADETWRAQYVAVVERLAALNHDINQELEILEGDGSLPRELAQNLSLVELAELLRWRILRLAPGTQLEVRLLQELALFAKIGRSGRRRPIRPGLEMAITRQNVEIYSF